MPRDKYGEIPFPEPAPGESSFQEGVRPLRKRKPYYNTTWKLVAYGAPILGFALVAGSLGLVWKSHNSSEELVQRTSDQYNPSFQTRYQDIGGQVIRSWYDKNPPVIDYSKGVKWPSDTSNYDGIKSGSSKQSPLSNVTFMEGYQSQMKPEESSSGGGSHSYEEILKYYALYDGKPVTITLDVGIPNINDKEARPVLLSSPTINQQDTPKPVDMQNNPTGAGLEPVDELNQATNAQLNNWAEAWTQDDQERLKQVVQDQSNKVYRGLGNGWTFDKSVSKVSSSWQYHIGIDGKQYLVAEITFPIQPQSQSQQPLSPPVKPPEAAAPGVLPPEAPVVSTPSSSSSSSDNSSSENTQTMDVLIDRPESGLPNIVAWGPPGSWQNLKPYQDGFHQ